MDETSLPTTPTHGAANNDHSLSLEEDEEEDVDDKCKKIAQDEEVEEPPSSRQQQQHHKRKLQHHQQHHVATLMPVVAGPSHSAYTVSSAAHVPYPVHPHAIHSRHPHPHYHHPFHHHHQYHHQYPYHHHHHQYHQYYHHYSSHLHHPAPPPPPPPPPQPQPQPVHQHQQYHVYPPALANHRDLVDSRELFYASLTKFHVALGTKLTIPKIGGKDLDLHLLYKEVTDRGGLERVINERKWKEITVVLDFPRTTTSASFVLRKYYINLLHHFEQVHYFRVQGLFVPPPVPPPITPMTQAIQPEFSCPALEGPEKDIRKRKMDSAQALGVDPASSIGSVVTGSIDAKLDYAYLVTVMVGARKMRGVMYHVPPSGSRPQNANVTMMSMVDADTRGGASVVDRRIGRRQKRRQMSRKDPNAPRQNRTGYNFFFAEQRAKLKSVQPDKDRAISKMIGDMWNRLSQDEKSPYQERGMEDKDRYRREMREYKERLRIGGQQPFALSAPLRTLSIAKRLCNDTSMPQQSTIISQQKQEQLCTTTTSDTPTTTIMPMATEPPQQKLPCKSCTSLSDKPSPCSSESAPAENKHQPSTDGNPAPQQQEDDNE